MKKQIVLLVTLFVGIMYVCGMEECPEPAAPATSVALTGESTVKFLSSDDQELEVVFDLAKQSETIKHMLEDIGEEGEAISLPITGKTLDEVVNALKDSFNENAVDERLKKLNLEELVAFINAVNYLDIPDLLHASIKELAERNLSQNEVNMLFESLAPAVIENLWALSLARNWMLEKWEENVKELEGALDVTFSPDGKYLVSRFWYEGTIWNVNNNFEQLDNGVQHEGAGKAIFSPDGRYLVSVSLYRGIIKIWDVNNNFEQVGDDLRHPLIEDIALDIIFSPDGRYLVSVSLYRGIIKIWDVNSGFQQVGDDLQHGEEVNKNGLIFSPDGRYLVSVSHDRGIIKIWDVNNNFEQVGDDLRHEILKEVVFSPDGRYLVSNGNGIIKILDVNKGFEQVGDNLQTSRWVVFSPDGRYLVSKGNGIIKILDVNKGFEQVGDNLQTDGWVVFSPDGRYLVSVFHNNRGTIKIWDVNNNFEQVDSDLRHKRVEEVVFSPDGRYLVSSSLRGLKHIRILDVNNNFEQIGDGLPHEEVDYIVFSPDSRYLITFADENGISKIWDMNIFRQIVNPTFDQIKLFLLAYFNVEKEQGVQTTNELRVTFDGLSAEVQALLPEQFREKFKAVYE